MAEALSIFKEIESTNQMAATLPATHSEHDKIIHMIRYNIKDLYRSFSIAPTNSLRPEIEVLQKKMTRMMLPTPRTAEHRLFAKRKQNQGAESEALIHQKKPRC